MTKFIKDIRKARLFIFFLIFLFVLSGCSLARREVGFSRSLDICATKNAPTISVNDVEINFTTNIEEFYSRGIDKEIFNHDLKNRFSERLIGQNLMPIETGEAEYVLKGNFQITEIQSKNGWATVKVITFFVLLPIGMFIPYPQFDIDKKIEAFVVVEKFGSNEKIFKKDISFTQSDRMNGYQRKMDTPNSKLNSSLMEAIDSAFVKLADEISLEIHKSNRETDNK